MLVLTVLQGPDKGRRFDLPDSEPQMIGRSAESLPLTDQTISRRHAELTPDDGKWFIRDLRSSNGTFVNGTRVNGTRQLRVGDQIRTGMTLLLFGESLEHKPKPDLVRLVGKDKIDVSLETTVASSDDSMIMAVPEPSQAAVLQLQVIYELTGLIGSITDRKQLLEQVMDVVFEYFKADRGFILLREKADAEPTPIVVRHRLGEKQKKTGPITVSHTIIRYVMKKGFGVLTSNAMTDKRFASGDSVQAFGIHSAMCVPIKFKDKLYGVIHLDSRIANYTYTEDQLTLLTAIGVQSGLALANMELVEHRLRAERLAAVGQTVASLSHSIKNIVQGLRGGAEVVELGMRKENMKVVQGGWEIVARNLDRVSELAMNMLAYSKERQPEFEMVNIAQVLDEVVQLQQKQFDMKKVALLVDVSPDLPPMPLDAAGIQQAVLNLLNNALDAVEPESGAVSLHCEFDPQRQIVSIGVTDNGRGMDRKMLAQLFEPFHSTKGLKGTGLGLVVTKKIVEEHGGRIDVDSTPGQGSTFTIELTTSLEAIHSSETQGPTFNSPTPAKQ